MDQVDRTHVISLTPQEERRHREAVEFLRTNFSAKKCTNFVPTPTNTKKCFCGGKQGEHKEIDKNVVIPNEGWNESCIVPVPTDAFGRIQFLPASEMFIKRAKYVRVAEDSDMEKVLELIQRFWTLDDPVQPELVISILGGGKHFHIADSRKKEMFNRGLIRSIHTTRGWILTFGTNSGVARAVGEAVKEGQSMEWYQDGSIRRTIHCIGIVPWGVIRGREDLINADPNNLSKAHHRVCPNEGGKISYSVTLNPHHSHFLLVDDGYRDQYWHKGKSALFRAKLERQIAEPLRAGGLGVPVICILIEGGKKSVTQLLESVLQGIPALVCEGTGRAADVVAFAWRKFSSIKLLQDEIARNKEMEELKQQVRQIVYCIYPESAHSDPAFDSMTNDVMRLCQEQELVSVFQFEHSGDLDLAILSRLMDRQKLDLVQQLKLAIKWNRADVAAQKIMADPRFQKRVKQEQLYELLMEALINNQADFVRLIMDYGLSIHRHLTVASLRELYNDTVTETSHLWSLMQFPRKRKQHMACPQLSLTDIYNVLRRLTRRYTNPLYKMEAQKSMELAQKPFPKPFEELFIWAILLNRRELALHFWEMCEDPLTVAVFGTALCGTLPSAVKNPGSDLIDEYQSLKDHLEQLAVGLVDQAYDINEDKALLLVNRPAPTWGNLTNMELAAVAMDKAFLSTACCQASIFKTWQCGIENNGATITFCAFTILPIYFLISFEDDAHATVTGPQEPTNMMRDVADGNFGGRSDGNVNSKPALLFTTARSPLIPIQKAQIMINLKKLTGTDVVASFASMQDVIERKGKVHYKRQTTHATAELSQDTNVEEPDVECKPGFHIIPGAQTIFRFYRAPVVKFTVHTAFYALYLLLYAHVILFALRPDPLWPEILLYVWQSAYIAEEIRQVLSYPGQSLFAKIADYWDFSSLATWNRVDCCTLIISISVFALRWTPATFSAARLMLVINFILYFVRLFKVYFVNSYLGPKVVMIKKMTWDVLLFLLMLIVFMTSYSVASQALMHVDRPFYWGIFWDLFLHGIWEVFGELDDESMTGTLENCGALGNSSSWTVDCVFQSWPVPLLLAAYLFFGNILLINMLIAVFANVFNDVQANAEQIWKYEMYALVEEFRLKPLLPAPFILFHHLWLVLCCWRRCKKTVKEDRVIGGRLMTKREMEFLGIFEKVSRSDFLDNRRRSEATLPESIATQLRDSVLKLIEALPGLNLSQPGIRIPTSESKGKLHLTIPRSASSLNVPSTS